MTKRRAKTTTIVEALRILVEGKRDFDVVAGVCEEAADRLEEMRQLLAECESLGYYMPKGLLARVRRAVK